MAPDRIRVSVVERLGQRATARSAVSFNRKQLNGLLGEALKLGADPYDGDCVVFVKKDRTQLRALVGDQVGLFLVTRRFEGGRLGKLLEFAEQPSASAISTAELSLEGATFTVHKRARTCRDAQPAARLSANTP